MGSATIERGVGEGGAFSHEALFYQGEQDFVDRVGAFLKESVQAREPILVVVSARKVELLRSMLGRDAWPDALKAWARAYRAAFREHPNMVPFLARGPARRPAALRLADAVYGALVEAGWPPSHATRIGAAMRYFVAGSALGSFALGFVDDPLLYESDYPHLRDAHRLAGLQSRIDDGAFELGLTALVDGFEEKFRRLKPPRTPA